MHMHAMVKYRANGRTESLMPTVKCLWEWESAPSMPGKSAVIVILISNRLMACHDPQA
jgi:hypothetical protein